MSEITTEETKFDLNNDAYDKGLIEEIRTLLRPFLEQAERAKNPPQATLDDLDLLIEEREKGQYSAFLRLVSGQCSYKNLRPMLCQPGLLTSRFLEMRDFSQTLNEEQGDGIYYHPKMGWYHLNKPFTGYYDFVRGSQTTGSYPQVDGCDLVVRIHSHTARKEWEQEHIGTFKQLLGQYPDQADKITRWFESIMENVALWQGLFSTNDVAATITKHSEANIVIGKHLACLVARTKNSPDQLLLEGKTNWETYETLVNELDTFGEIIRKEHLNFTSFEESLLQLYRIAGKYQLGVYFMRLRDEVSTDDFLDKI